MEQIRVAHQSLIGIINSIAPDTKSKISSISIRSRDLGNNTECYHIHIDLATFLPCRMDIQQEVDLLLQDIHFSGWERHPGLTYVLPIETDIAGEIMDLGDSGVLGKIDAARFDCDDPASCYYYGYPHWLIKPITRPILKGGGNHGQI